jgi:STE20-like kinase
MLIRHEKELEHHRRVGGRREEELLKRQTVEKRALPKRIRNEMRIREMMFRESLRIQAPGSTPASGPEDEKERMKKFKDAEQKKYKAEQTRLENKHQKQLEEARGNCEAAKRELEQLQNEKRSLLTQHEDLKIKELDENCSRILREFKSSIPPKQDKLEAEFAAQLMEQRRFYGDMTGMSSSVTMNGPTSESSSMLFPSESNTPLPTSSYSNSSLESDT